MSQIEITPELLNELRQKAEAATIEYDWKLHDDQKNWPVIEFGNRPGEDCGGFTIKGNYSPKLIQDAEFIAAANPAVVLALVDEVERLKDRLEDLICSGCNQQPKFCSCELVPLSGSELIS
jgi:hypothetical protein